MKTDRKNGVFTAIRMAAASHPLLTAGTLLCVAASVAASLLPPARGVNFLVRRGMSLEERYFGPTALFNEREKRRLLADYAGDGDPMFLTEAIWDATEGLDPVTRMQQVDLNLWLAGDILLKADKMSMAHSLELRVPFLDREVWALAAALPAAAKADARTTKIALRRAAARTLPAASAAHTSSQCESFGVATSTRLISSSRRKSSSLSYPRKPASRAAATRAASIS